MKTTVIVCILVGGAKYIDMIGLRSSAKTLVLNYSSPVGTFDSV